jgi:2'-5' RNA ligase
MRTFIAIKIPEEIRKILARIQTNRRLGTAKTGSIGNKTLKKNS